jgi:tRNA-uridine 2-sulfurtransferase
MSKKVFVGMSGGVDSSVTAALLKECGYDVTGVYMKNWSQDLPGFVCFWKEDYQDAKRVAVQLGIDFKLYDFETEYRHKVVDYMVGEYQAGRTPNPDIMCNQEVKFKLFLETALEDGAEMIATGHYARVASSSQLVNSSTRYSLLEGLDTTKDQSYFLYRVTEEALSRSLMPIGELHKTEVRKLAKKLGLATADKPDSQGICFVGQVGIKEFLLHELGPQPAGPIIDHNGKEIGQHDGAIFYTIGQRHGLNIGGGLPYYVTRKDMKNNTVYVTTNLDDDNLWHQEVKLLDLHWINEAPSTKHRVPSSSPLANLPTPYYARLRYRGPLVECDTKGSKLTLKEPQRGLAAGQSAVIYKGDRVLGGGIMSI